jgi:hypothetical protein
MKLSVVVTIVEGGDPLRQCLARLSEQIDPPDLEIIVPYDDTVNGIDDLRRAFPRVNFLGMGRVQTSSTPSSPRGQHELFDRRRTSGLLAATGEVVAILEDRGLPTERWASSVARLHSELPFAVIGGAVENGIDRYLNWAVYFCDFSRYQRPFNAGPADWVTDVNVSYKRRALDATRALWRDRYHEPVVHGALRARGETLFLTPDLVVHEMRSRAGVVDLLRERLHWGRLFAYTRVQQEKRLRRVVYLSASPLIPLIMFFRQAHLQWKKGHFARFARVAPAVALLLTVWGAGETVGYLTARP